MHTLNGDPNVAALQKYTVELYEEIERVSGIDCGIHLTGGLLLADTEERMDWLRLAHARNRYLGLETEMISVEEAKRFLPIMDEQHFVGAMFDPVEGNVDPSGRDPRVRAVRAPRRRRGGPAHPRRGDPTAARRQLGAGLR